MSGTLQSRVPGLLPGLGATSEVVWPARRCTSLLSVPERDCAVGMSLEEVTVWVFLVFFFLFLWVFF